MIALSASNELTITRLCYTGAFEPLRPHVLLVTIEHLGLPSTHPYFIDNGVSLCVWPLDFVSNFEVHLNRDPCFGPQRSAAQNS